MFPQYTATTSASASDSLFNALKAVRRVPAVRFVPPYYSHHAYLDAVAGIVRDDLAKLPWEPEHVLVSFHGIPQEYARRGDPYATHVVRTTQGLVQRLAWKRDYWTQTYQSRFGKRPWLKPYTDDVLTVLAKRGVKRVAVALPGFTSDVAWKRWMRSATNRGRCSSMPAAKEPSRHPLPERGLAVDRRDGDDHSRGRDGVD